MNKLRVAIIGTGNIGTDLLIKINKSEFATCALFAGRNLNSKGMSIAQSLNVPVSDKGHISIIDNSDICDVVIDCTSAVYHAQHWEKLKYLNKLVIDMTPAKIGDFYIPVLNDVIDDNLSRKMFYNLTPSLNINMITCGGQASIPIAYAISTVHPDIEYLEVASSIASLSAGPATRYNLDEYVETTQKALSQFTGVEKTKVILILNPATPCIDMQTSIYAKIKKPSKSIVFSLVSNIL
jgi:acetaldehyde dehydrogenase